MTATTKSASTTTTPTITGVSHIDLSVTDLDRSEKFYIDLLGASRVLEGRSDHNHLSSRYLLHAASFIIIGLVQHDHPESQAFEERCVGLDHLSFNVASGEELVGWVNHLDALGIAHSGIADEELWDVLVVRDPDNIQLEFFYMKPAAASLITG